MSDMFIELNSVTKIQFVASSPGAAAGFVPWCFERLPFS